MIIPGTLGQLLALLLLVTPGFAFSAVRSRLAGPSPANRDFGIRLLSALLVGTGIDAVYVLVGGGWVIAWVTRATRPGGLDPHPRLSALLSLCLLVLIPAVLAWVLELDATGRLLSSFRTRLGRAGLATGTYDPTPSAWDYAAPQQGDTFVRVRIEANVWVGGWFGRRSFISGWPEGRDMFIESQWQMGPEGQFLSRLPHTKGVFVSCSGDGVVVEWVEPPDAVQLIGEETRSAV